MISNQSKSQQSKNPATIRCVTRIVAYHDMPGKEQIEVMLFGRPAFYYAPTSEQVLIDRLRRAYIDGSDIQVEWNPDTLQILQAGSAPY